VRGRLQADLEILQPRRLRPLDDLDDHHPVGGDAGQVRRMPTGSGEVAQHG